MNEKSKEKLGLKIRKIRINLGETMEEFGVRFNSSKGTINNWEKGRNRPNKTNLKIIAEIENLTVHQLLNGKDQLSSRKELLEEIRNLKKEKEKLISEIKSFSKEKKKQQNTLLLDKVNRYKKQNKLLLDKINNYKKETEQLREIINTAKGILGESYNE